MRTHKIRHGQCQRIPSRHSDTKLGFGRAAARSRAEEPSGEVVLRGCAADRAKPCDLDRLLKCQINTTMRRREGGCILRFLLAPPTAFEGLDADMPITPPNQKRYLRRPRGGLRLRTQTESLKEQPPPCTLWETDLYSFSHRSCF